MGLIKSYYEPRFEVTISDCYWKIDVENGVTGGKNFLRVRLSCYKNKTIADGNRDKYSDFDFDFTPNLSEGSANYIEQAYNYAKTLPEFADAIDA